MIFVSERIDYNVIPLLIISETFEGILIAEFSIKYVTLVKS